MKKILLLTLMLAVLPITNIVSGIKANTEYTTELKGKKNVKVKSYKKKDGTRVKSHKRSSPKRK